MLDFDADAAALPGSGLYGLPTSPEEARVVVVPVPFSATTSYGGGAWRGPSAVLSASRQVDLYDLEYGRVYASGLAMLPEPDEVRAWHREAEPLAQEVLAVGGVVRGVPALEAALARVNALGAAVNAHTRAAVEACLDRGQRVALLGGDHAVPFGCILAHAARHPGLGILHLDAHADLRVAYEGFPWSHASIMDNVLREAPGVAKIVQVGVRDLGEAELRAIERSDGRVVPFFDHVLATRRFEGEPWGAIVRDIVAALPETVYLSFDIDGLDPTLCPHTGTPVPGGLGFREVCALLRAVARSGRRIVGMDLVEVVPGPDGDSWDGNVAARLLYKMLGAMWVSLDGAGKGTL
jgi:agmatinase